MLLGLIRPDEGSAKLFGRNPLLKGARALDGVAGFVEAPRFYPYLSGRKNLELAAALDGGGAAGRIGEALDTVDLADRAKDKVGGYSHGMRQRLGIAGALLRAPRLLLLDEPTTGLDPAGMAEMRDFIRTLGREGRTVLLSSHLMVEVEQVCDRVGVLSKGTLIREGTVEELRGGDHSLWVHAEPLQRAAQLLEALPEVEAVAAANGGLRVTTTPQAAPAINRALVHAGVAVSELRQERASLEEVFLQLTRQPKEEA
jgi:ABC-2 type transport system ATP-binding protein